MTEQMKKLMGLPANEQEQREYAERCSAVDALWRERAAEEKFGFGSREHRQAVAERFKAWGLN